MGQKYVCPICGNEDEKYIGIRNGQPYCRLCLSFKGKQAEYIESKPKKTEYSLNYSLCKEQSTLSAELVKNFINGYNSFVHAVCGSGKTEIVLETIKYAITYGYKVGFAVPRRDVAVELCERFNNIFKKNKITLVYGGHTNCLYGDLIVLTTHQLYRYDCYFDLLIIDEVDAFPFKGNVVLNSFFNHAYKRNYIMMSATPDKDFIDDFLNSGGKLLELNSRFHKYPLPVPEIKIAPEPIMWIILLNVLNKFIKENKQVFIFCPTISLCEETFDVLKIRFPHKGNSVHSKKENRETIISDFRNKKYMFLVTTAVLERGITVKDLQVIVFHAENSIYNRYNLVQIAGRVGRKADAPIGEVIYVANKSTKDMEESIRDIERSNKDLQNML